MRFPSVDDLPILTPEETASWFYPLFEGRPYTEPFANKVIDIISVEERFWRYMKYVKQTNSVVDIYFDLVASGSVSLPKWSFQIKDQTFSGDNRPSTLSIQIDGMARMRVEPDGEVDIAGDWSSRLSELGKVVKYLLPYMDAIYIVTDEDQASLLLPVEG